MLCLLGQPMAVSNGYTKRLDLQPKALALLAYLALTPQAVERRELAELLFPDADEPRAALRWHLSYLRSTTPDLITQELHATRSHVQLTLATDVAQFRQGVQHILESPASPKSSEILDLYRSDLLTVLTVSASADFDVWLYVEQENLRRRFRQAVVVVAHWALKHQKAMDVIPPLSRLVSVDPYFEDAHELLIECYESLGQHDQARGAYDRYQRIMREDLRTEPRSALARRFEPSSPSRHVEPRDALISLTEVTIHVVDRPGAEPVILGIHGSGQSAYGLDALGEQLAPGIRFVALDLRGHGFSDKPSVGYDLEHHVSDIVQLIDALQLKNPIILGHSAGGTIATFVAGQTSVGGLILLDGMVGDRAFMENATAQSSPLADALDRRYASLDMYLEQARAYRATLKRGLSDEAERLLERWAYYNLAPLPDGSFRLRALRHAVEAEWASLVKADSLGTLAHVNCPVLIVQAIQPWFDGHPYFTDATIAAQMYAAPQAELFVAERSNHSDMVRDPEPAMIRRIQQFVQRCVPG